MVRSNTIALAIVVAATVLVILIMGFSAPSLLALLLAAMPISFLIVQRILTLRTKKNLTATKHLNRADCAGTEVAAFREDEVNANAAKRRFSKQVEDSSSMSSADIIFEKWTQIEASSIKGQEARIFIAGSTKSDTMQGLLMTLKDEGYSVDTCNVLEEVLQSIVVSPEKWRYLFVDLDNLREADEYSEIIDSLSEFRRISPAVVLLLVSETFGSDDFSTHRLLISDISLKLLVNADELADNLGIARANNSIWQARLRTH
jgi:hypothetical protein